jgi:hypothetical protein
MITDQDAKKWYNNLTEEQKINIYKEWRELKQKLCSEILLVPTGCKDWVSRSIEEGKRLSICERLNLKV